MRKRLLFLSILLLLTFNILVILNLNMVRVSAGESPTIAVVPNSIMDPTLTVGENFTISIYTNYTGDDVWAYEFTLSYNRSVILGGINYTDTWPGDGSTTEWNTTYPPHYDSEKVYVNSVLKPPRMQGNDTWTSDGSTQVYNTTGSPVVELSEEVYVDGILKRRKSEEKTDTWVGDGSTTQFNTTELPIFPGSDTVFLNKTDTWPGDGSTTEFFTTEQPILIGTEKVYVNDTIQQRDLDYTINYVAGNIAFTTAPPNGVEVKASYRFKVMERNVDYTINYVAGNIAFTTAPPNGVGIEARYKHGHYEIHYPSGTITFNSNSVPGAGSDINALYTYKEYDIEYAVDLVVGTYATIKFPKPPGLGDDIDVEYLYGGVDNGDLISFSDPFFAGFTPGLHNVTEGKLRLTTANLLPLPIAKASGPGTLANVTFQVVGYGSSNITLGPETKLKKAVTYEPIPGIQLEHGFFRNLVTVREYPVAYFTYSPAAPIVGETVTFNASLTTPDGGTITSYEWNFGDDNTTTTVNPIITHAYTAEGTYNVTLTITDSEGLTDITYDIVTVREPPPSGIPWHLYMAPAGVIAIVVVAIVFYFLRIRKPKPT